MNTPNKERIKLWTDALRSGSYQQVQGSLRGGLTATEGYCCLGVAVEVALDNGWKPEWAEDPRRSNFDDDRDYVYSTHNTLPHDLVRWYGLPDDNPNLDTDGITNCVTANDEQEWDFVQIADAVDMVYVNETSTA